MIYYNIKRRNLSTSCVTFSYNCFKRYERGEREIPLWAAIKLADYYGVSLDYLVGRE